MIQIGNKDLVLSETFLVKDNEEINIEAEIDDWHLKLTLTIAPLPAGTSYVNWLAVSENHARIEFHGWGNGLASAIPEPIAIGTTDTTGRTVLFSACNYRVGPINRLDFQLYLGGAK